MNAKRQIDLASDDDWNFNPQSWDSNPFSSHRCITLPAQKRLTGIKEDPSELNTAIARFAEVIRERTKQNLKIDILERVVSTLRQKVVELQSQKVYSVAINTLAPQDLKLKQPIWISIQPEDDEYCAILIDANINASGDTPFDAIENLKDLIGSTFLHFSSLGEEKLGPGPRKQLSILRTLIE